MLVMHKLCSLSLLCSGEKDDKSNGYNVWLEDFGCVRWGLGSKKGGEWEERV